MLGQLKRLLVGRPLTEQHSALEKLSVPMALAVFSSDALSSVAYASEEILLMLRNAAVESNGYQFTFIISMFISGLLVILTMSYRQLVVAYPSGGGAYSVSKENIGMNSSLWAGGALIIDYVLTVAVSIAAGAAAVTSAFPELLPHRVLIANLAILILMFINLRGIKESGTIFAIPTWIFVVCMYTLFIWLFVKSWGTPESQAVQVWPQSTEGVGLWLLLRAFSSGCAAVTGIEALSNGVGSFKKPEAQNARVAMLWMGIILATMFLGVSYFVMEFHITPNASETVVSQLARRTGNMPFYYLIQGATALILFLAANTSFNAFPVVTSLLAEDRFLPRQLASRGDRLVFSNGILGLGVVSMVLIWAFNSDVHKLIPMYAIGVFLCFSLSQWGLIHYWKAHRPEKWQKKVFINALGLAVSLSVLVVLTLTKFTHGAWVVFILIPAMVYQFRKIKYHYLIVGNQLRLVGPAAAPAKVHPHHVLVPVSGIHKGVIEALNYGRSISTDITACYIDISPRTTAHLKEDWIRYGMGVKLEILTSPFRSVIRPLLDFIELEIKRYPDRFITVIIPEFVTAKWWQNLLHNQTAIIIRAALTFKKRVVVTSVRYHLVK